ncbi:hypothetical protein GCM10008955_12270 [Deinococcus malanensis]|uniref:Uncharacterized protein n=1 Tax=Deinococcus malanensis TaxID=1706855 RepID=A0ABQ2EPN9_9DEIO|nr:hypothetical protein [Deinococcus malanensis]GGK20393.1 hypothetical protein GCM10008955_12270 [Deinococcus malanensis]
MIAWIDLYIEGDPHPRRFDTLLTLGDYLRRIERLPDEAVSALLQFGEVAPPTARRGYRLGTLPQP